MNYADFEDAIVELLDIPGVDISVLPHVAALNELRPTMKPQLFVIINGATFEQPDNMGVMSQLGSVSGEIFMRAKSRRGNLGIFDLYTQICGRLMGVKLAKTKRPITLSQFGYVAGLQNNWQYSLTFSFTAYERESMPPEPELTIKQINFKPYGEKV